MNFYKVNKFLCKRPLLYQFKRYIQDEHVKILYPLENRSLIKVTGTEAMVFLQGLITNDMKHFDEGANSMYTMFLNNKGRVLYDSLLYKSEQDNTYLLECDRSVLSSLQKHLKIFKLKRAVEFADINTLIKLWVLITPESFKSLHFDSDVNICLYKDPRLTELGYRILASQSLSGQCIAQMIDKDVIVADNESGYKYLRYKLGVSEGSEDLPPGTCFPLEANCDYLHGVSFHKGCYIGQEVTARVHHTGVVRKRMMPLKFTELNGDLKNDSVISVCDNPKSNLGKLKGFTKNYGLGLIRIKEALEAKMVKVGETLAEPIKPAWWPLEAPKENLSHTKPEQTV